MGRMIWAAVVSSVLAAVLCTLLLRLLTGEANPAIVAGVTGAVAASSAITSRRKPQERENAPFGGAFDTDAPAKAGD